MMGPIVAASHAGSAVAIGSILSWRVRVGPTRRPPGISLRVVAEGPAAVVMQDLATAATPRYGRGFDLATIAGLLVRAVVRRSWRATMADGRFEVGAWLSIDPWDGGSRCTA